jgi:Ca2+-transporting ATPase
VSESPKPTTDDSSGVEAEPEAATPQTETPSWHARPPEEAIEAQGVDPESGLSRRDAEHRLREHGRNRLREREGASVGRLLARQFADVLIAILAVAAAISLAIGEWIDAAAILAILVLNGVLGFVQEWRAERAIAALRRMLAPEARVLREGREQTIPAARIVPGDVVLLETGDRVPADLRLIQAEELRVDESALTGEAVPVDKQIEPVEAEATLDARGSMAWMGTVLTGGRGRGVVVATGTTTEFGRIAEMTHAVERERTPLQRDLASLGRRLGALALALSALVAVGGWLTGKPPLEMLLTGVSLAVAVVPEGLPALVTITLAVGIRAMVRRHALLRRLSAAETLGAASVICTDKTGTLTRNEMTVRRIWLAAGRVSVSGSGYEPEGRFEAGEGESTEPVDPGTRRDLETLLEIGLYCNHARLEQDEDGVWQAIGDPTEAALVVAARKAGLEDPADDPERERPFDADRKRMSVVYHLDDERTSLVKGAPEVILDRSTAILDGDEERALGDEDREAIAKATEELAEEGLRTLALARRRVEEDADDEALESDLTLVGLVGILDPPRPEVAGAIEEARSAGIRVLVITGDAEATALAIAEKIGLSPSRSLTGRDLEEMDDETLREAVREPVLFARTAPEQKLRIVEALQDQGEVVAMTGDGVNDAPALKRADIGIAMGIRGTDVARGAADMVLADDNFASIVAAVREGRRQHDNIRKFVGSLLSSNLGELVAILVHTLMVGGALILLPVQILWMNLVTDGLLAIALGVEPPERDVMWRPPRRPDERILSWRFGAALSAIGLYVGLAILWLFVDAREAGRSLEDARSLAFSGLIALEIVYALNFRGLRAPLVVLGPLGNPWLWLAIAGTIALQLGVLYWPPAAAVLHVSPLPASDLLRLLALAVPLWLVPEIVKTVVWWRSRRGGNEAETS